MTDAACVPADEPTDEADDAAEQPAGLTEQTDDATDDAAADDAEAVDTSHLDDMADGCGCAEVWEHLSEQRGESRAE